MVSAVCTANQTDIAIGNGSSIGLATTAQNYFTGSMLAHNLMILSSTARPDSQGGYASCRRTLGLRYDEMRWLNWKRLPT